MLSPDTVSSGYTSEGGSTCYKCCGRLALFRGCQSRLDTAPLALAEAPEATG